MSRLASHDEGVLYIATGEQHVGEALENAQASSSYVGGRPLVLITDRVNEAKNACIFDQVLPHPDPVGSYRDKIGPMR